MLSSTAQGYTGEGYCPVPGHKWRTDGLAKGASPTSANADLVALCYHAGMSQPVKLSDALVLDARLAGEAMERSIAGQVEFWARLGRSVELLLAGQEVLKLSRNAAVRPLSECLKSVDSAEGRKRTAAWLATQPFPHYEPDPHKAGLLIRIDGDGRRTLGRFIKRQFKPVRISGKVKAAG